MQWHLKSERPPNADWYATWWHKYPKHVTPRYFDDSAKLGLNWFILRPADEMEESYDYLPNNDEPESCLTVNMSFDMWAELPEAPPVEEWRALLSKMN